MQTTLKSAQTPGQFIAGLRARLGVTQAVFATKIGTAHEHVSRLEHDGAYRPGRPPLVKLIRLVGEQCSPVECQQFLKLLGEHWVPAEGEG